MQRGTGLREGVAEVSEPYRVVVTREDDAWLADVPDLPGAHTWGRSLAALHRSVREVIALVEDLPEGAEDDLDVVFDYQLGEPDVGERAAALRKLRERIERDERKLAEGTAAAVEELTRAGYSVRDVAALLSISPQRVSQIQPRRQPPRSAARGGATPTASRQAAAGR